MISSSLKSYKRALKEVIEWKKSHPDEYEKVMASDSPPDWYLHIRGVLPLAGMEHEEMMTLLLEASSNG